jgi:dipeptidyl aminopeptidase/acylaminoacyl peptidase
MNNPLRTAARAATLCLALAAPAFFVAASAQQPSPSPSSSPSPSQSPSPAPPDTEIFLVELKPAGGSLAFGQPANITRRAGYDNQPSFTPDGAAVLFTSQREGEQTDIYRHDLKTGAATRLTSTPESEYSPTVMPGGKFFSVVRVEADRTQRLWKFPLAGGEPSLVLAGVKPVGYHLWLNERDLALFVLGDEKQSRPVTLQVATLGRRPGEASEVSTLATSIGRSLQLVPRTDAFSFVHKLSPTQWLVKTVDLKAHRTMTLAPTLPGSEDTAWLPDGTLLMAQGSKLFRLDPAAKEWREAADFAPSGLARITRIAVSPRGDRLALVAQAAPAR